MLNIKVLYNDNAEELFCSYSKERIALGEKYAIVLFDNYDGSVDESVYKLENLPTEDENEDY